MTDQEVEQIKQWAIECVSDKRKAKIEKRLVEQDEIIDFEWKMEELCSRDEDPHRRSY